MTTISCKNDKCRVIRRAKAWLCTCELPWHTCTVHALIGFACKRLTPERKQTKSTTKFRKRRLAPLGVGEKKTGAILKTKTGPNKTLAVQKVTSKASGKKAASKVSRLEHTERLVARLRVRCPRLETKLRAESTFALEGPRGVVGSVARVSSNTLFPCSSSSGVSRSACL